MDLKGDEEEEHGMTWKMFVRDEYDSVVGFFSGGDDGDDCDVDDVGDADESPPHHPPPRDDDMKSLIPWEASKESL